MHGPGLLDGRKIPQTKNGAGLTPSPVFKRSVSYPTREHSSQHYAAANAPKPVPMMQIAKKAMPMIGYFMLALLLITFIPAISLCLL